MLTESITARERKVLHLLTRERLRNALLAAISLTGQSRPGGGARFAITLPLGAPPGLGSVADDDQAPARS
jgi:hypothetical protein